MARQALEVADIFRDHGPAWRIANAGHISLAQMKVMSAIERCRTAALGGHVARCENSACGHSAISFNSCRNRHCPKCQGTAARKWLAEREADLLPIGYFHLVYTLPAPIAAIAWHNKRVIYDLLFKASAETTLTIAADPKHLGARTGITAVLHTWGSAMTHHPHVHMIVPGGGLSADGSKWISCRKRYFLPVPVLSRLFRRLFLKMLVAAHASGCLKFFGDHAGLANSVAFARFVRPLRKVEWITYAKEPFAGPKSVLSYLSRYTHRVAMSNSRLIKADAAGVTFKYKDYRVEGPERYKTMTLSPHEFIRRFLMHARRLDWRHRGNSNAAFRCHPRSCVCLRASALATRQCRCWPRPGTASVAFGLMCAMIAPFDGRAPPAAGSSTHPIAPASIRAKI